MKNPVTWFVRYLREAKVELAKVTWPSREETIKYSTLTISISLLIAAFFWVLDQGLQYGLEQLIEVTA